MTTPVRGAVAVPSPTPTQIAGPIALNLAVFLAALAVSCLLLGRYLPFPEVPVVSEKIEHLARYGDDYDVLFLGSSRVYYQMMPAVFDRIAHEQGLPIRSFNAGIGAMASPEDGYFLDQVLHRPHGRLRWVFLEIMPLSARADPILLGTGRFAYWRDWQRTRLFMECFLQDCVTACHGLKLGELRWSEAIPACFESLGVCLSNLGLFLENCSNLGSGEALIRRALGPSKKSKAELLRSDEKWDGWAYPVIAKPLGENAKRRADYESAYASLLATEDRFDPGDAVSWEALQIKIARLLEAKVTPILVIPPTTAARRYFPPQLAALSLTVLDFSDPRKYPEFFSIDHRLDGKHLNAAGAEIYTEVLARQSMEVLKKVAPAP